MAMAWRSWQNESESNQRSISIMKAENGVMAWQCWRRGSSQKSENNNGVGEKWRKYHQ
jgi:hypothetical protein